MTKAAKFLKRFPKAQQNHDVLCDIACPKCSNRERFKIAYSTMGVFVDDGEEEQEGDNEWTGRSYIECESCSHNGTVSSFTFRGLDDLIEATATGHQSMPEHFGMERTAPEGSKE